MTETQLILQLIEQLQSSYEILNHNSGVMITDIAVLKNQVGEMVFWGRFIVAGILAIIIERLVAVVMTYKKNGKKK